MIDLLDPLCGLRSHDSQYVILDPVFIQLFYIFQHSPISRLSHPVMPVSVVKGAVAVHRHSHEEIMFLKEAAPLIVQAKSVRLDRIHDPRLVSVKPLFQLQRLLIEIYPSQGRFPSLKCEADFPSRLMHGFPDQIFQGFLRHHSIRRYAAFLHLVAIETIIAMHVARSGDRFDQHRM